MDVLYHGFPQEDESPKKEKIPCQDVDHLGRKDHDERSRPSTVSVGDEIDETHGRCRSPLMIVDMFTKSDRNHIANSLGLELQDRDQNDDIGYMKKVLVCYIEEVGDYGDYGFDHIIVTSGKSDKRTQDWLGAPWIAVSDGIVIETKDYSSYDHHAFPVEKNKQENEVEKKSPKKKHHH
ncbi:hypothetical protein C1646_749601 [Rhizophagus diaphanus]|nr:hypothetical protein C1646_749601 [Rhizophagus diaphanus] [Rhizophagus sp. MUCL 43196]